ncbi:MAG: GAF domain-containing protein, partial [Chloroflexota bacterium]
VSVSAEDQRLPASVASAGEPVVASSIDGILGRLADVPRASHPFFPGASLEVGLPIPDFHSLQSASSSILCVAFCRPMGPEEVRRTYNAVDDITQGLSPVLYYASLLEQYQALQELSNAVTHSLKLDRVLDTLLELVTGVFGFDFATVSLVDEARGVIEAVRGRGEPVSDEWMAMAVHPLDSNDIQAYVVRTGKTEIISGWDDRFDREIWERFGHRDMVRVFLAMSVMDPATGERKCIGTLEAGYRQPPGAQQAEITDAQVEFLRPFVNQAAVAVAKARLYQEMQQLYEETQRLYQETRQTASVLTALHHGGQAIQSAIWDHEQLLQQIGHSAETVLGADLVLLFDYDEEHHQAELLFIGGDVRGKGTPSPRLDQGNILDAIIEERKPFYRPDAQKEPLLVDYGEAHRPGHRTFTQRQGVISFAGLPLMSGDELVGIMCVNYRDPHPFSAEEQRIIELFAQQAAIALKSDRLRNRERQLTVARERTALSKELHCYLSTELFAIGVKTDTALLHLSPDEEHVRSEMEDVLEIIRDAKQRLGYLIAEFEADDVPEEDFPTALEDTVERIRRYLHIDVRCRGNGGHELPPRVHFALSRIAKEALNNIIRHANCTSAEVTYAITSHAASLQMVDDGRGFRIGRVLEKSERMGIKNIQHHVDSVHGELTIESAPGRGTVISVRVPRRAAVEGV